MRKSVILNKRKSERYRTSRFVESIKGISLYTFILVAAIAFLVPVFWMVSTSLKTRTEVYSYPPQWISQPVMWQNYIEAWNSLPMITFFKNSAIVSLGTVIGLLISCSLVAYGFARLRFRGRDLLFIVMLSTLMLPPQMTMIPLYIFFSRLGWVNTLKPLIWPNFLTYPFGAYFIFLLRQFIMTIPTELDDAAKIDGCGFFGIYWRIVLPLSKPGLIVVGLFGFVMSWNQFLLPLIYLNTLDKLTLPLGLELFQNQFGGIAVHHVMAMATAITIPIIAIFSVTQKWLLRGITLVGGLKG